MQIRELIGKFRELAGNCSGYEAAHRKDGKESAAEMHRGAKEAFDRCANELEALVAPEQGERFRPVETSLAHTEADRVYGAGELHEFKGRADRDCEVCGRPDRAIVHSAVLATPKPIPGEREKVARWYLYQFAGEHGPSWEDAEAHTKENCFKAADELLALLATPQAGEMEGVGELRKRIQALTGKELSDKAFQQLEELASESGRSLEGLLRTALGATGDVAPNKAIATATASSKKLDAPINPAGAAILCGTLSFLLVK